MDGEELDLAVGLIIEAHGPELDRTALCCRPGVHVVAWAT